MAQLPCLDLFTCCQCDVLSVMTNLCVYKIISSLLRYSFLIIFNQIGGLVAMLASFYLLSEGWATATYSPFYILIHEEFFSQCPKCLTFEYLFFYLFLFAFVSVTEDFSCQCYLNLTECYHGKIEMILGIKPNKVWG